MALLPTDAQIETLLNNPPAGSVRMLNLLKFKAQAEYAAQETHRVSRDEVCHDHLHARISHAMHRQKLYCSLSP